VRKLARKLGVDLSQVAGSGPRNRILKEDVQSYVKSALQNRDTIHSRSGLNLIPKPQVDFSQYGDIETIELSKINKLTGKNTHRSWVSIPHVTQFDEADITDLEHFRKSIKAEYAEKGVSITLLPFVVKAVVSGLKALPRFNASLDDAEENLILKHYYNVGIAVDTPYGLVVPVVKDVDRKSITEIAIEITELATKAKDKKLSPADMQGGCFTISSLGHIGGTGFTPIINEPEVAILGLSKSTLKPIFDGNAFQPRLMLPLSLSYDHRVIDGVLAAKFTQHIADVLADARKMLL
jgi:pyruvate dehydrogenase E2 component (dihydrolipoamide acetyltransferase)